MSHPRPLPPAALIISLFSAREPWLAEAEHLLIERFGPLAEVSPLLPFTQTAYYAAEFGEPLVRRFLRFAALIPQDSLAAVKLACWELEERLTESGRRRVNIDCGLLTAERMLLATGKNYTHRVPLTGGVFADLALIFGHGSLQPLPWTYPDYASPEIIDLLNRFRAGYIVQLRGEV